MYVYLKTCKYVFLSRAFLLFGQLIHCLEISGNKNNLSQEQFEAEIAKKLITAQPQPKVTGSYKKEKRVARLKWSLIELKVKTNS